MVVGVSFWAAFNGSDGFFIRKMACPFPSSMLTYSSSVLPASPGLAVCSISLVQRRKPHCPVIETKTLAAPPTAIRRGLYLSAIHALAAVLSPRYQSRSSRRYASIGGCPQSQRKLSLGDRGRPHWCEMEGIAQERRQQPFCASCLVWIFFLPSHLPHCPVSLILSSLPVQSSPRPWFSACIHEMYIPCFPYLNILVPVAHTHRFPPLRIAASPRKYQIRAWLSIDYGIINW